MRKWFPLAGWTAGILYAAVAVFAVAQFNYRTIQTEGFFYWLMPGELEATVKGVFWPYFWWTEHRAEQQAEQQFAAWQAVALSAEEWATVRDALPAPPRSFTTNDLNVIKSALARYTARTGRTPKDSDLAEQLRLGRTVIEWRAEAAASIGRAWDTRSTFRTPRFTDLTERLDTYMWLHKDTARYVGFFYNPADPGSRASIVQFVAERETYNRAIAGAAAHIPRIETISWTLDLASYSGFEKLYRFNLAEYDKAMAQLATK